MYARRTTAILKPSCPISIGRRLFSAKKHGIVIADEVQAAIAAKAPVVALESTIYTHGLPYPQNLELAFHLSTTARKHGAIPATCAVVDGVARVGLDEQEVRRLIDSRNARKVSRRDLAYVTGLRQGQRGLNGGTTISGTMILAHLAGIHVFATGGLGGVHRGGESSLDISADLTELGRTPVAVISSGPKGFLDIPRTLEYLETQGVHVSTFADGRRGNIDFPAFWARESGIRSPMIVQDELEAAAIINAQLSLPLTSGMLFANPVPAKYSIPREEMVEIIDTALSLADQAGAVGNANTPFVLNAIRELSRGRSVPANKALVEANVIRGAKVAVELSKLQQKADSASRPSNFMPHFLSSEEALSTMNQDLRKQVLSEQSPLPRSPPRRDSVSANPTPSDRFEEMAMTTTMPNVIIAGSLAVDVSCDYTPLANSPQAVVPQPYTSNPSRMTESLGGVGANVARAIHSLGAEVRFCSAVADDLSGRGAIQALSTMSIDTSGVQILPSSSGIRTARYVAFNDAKKNLIMAMADMDIIEHVKPAQIETQWSRYLHPSTTSVPGAPSHLVLDANWSPASLHAWLRAARRSSITTVFEPVSTAKALRLLTPAPDSSSSNDFITTYPQATVHLTTPNSHELVAMHTAARSAGLFDRADWWSCIDALGIPSTGARVQLSLLTSPALVDGGIPQRALQLLPFVPIVVTKLGKDGVMLAMLLGEDDPRLRSQEAAPYILSRTQTGERGIGGVYLRLFAPAEIVPEEEVVSVSGCGDTFLGALIAGLVRKEKEGLMARVEDVIMFAQQAACLTLRSKESISPELKRLKF